MTILWMALLGVLLALLLVRFGPVARKRQQEGGPNDGMHKTRIGDGLRRLRENKAKYGTLTPELLAQTEDDDLIEAVLSNLWAKMQPDMSDALTVMRGQNEARRMIFALYAVTGGVKQAGFVKLKDSPDAELLPVALVGLETLEMPQSAALLREAMEDGADADAMQTPYGEAFAGEAGKERMIAYIREHPAAFSD